MSYDGYVRFGGVFADAVASSMLEPKLTNKLYNMVKQRIMRGKLAKPFYGLAVGRTLYYVDGQEQYFLHRIAEDTLMNVRCTIKPELVEVEQALQKDVSKPLPMIRITVAK